MSKYSSISLTRPAWTEASGTWIFISLAAEATSTAETTMGPGPLLNIFTLGSARAVELLWLVGLGAAAGAVGSVTGLGGGIVMVPALTAAGVPPVAAVSNSLFAVLASAAGSSAAYWRQRRAEYAAGVRLGLVSAPGTVAGAVASSEAAPAEFRVLFAALLVASGAYVLLRHRLRPSRASGARAVAGTAAASFAAGAVSAFFGVGGGVVFVPLLVVALGMDLRRAAPTSQVILLFAASSGAAAHYAMGHPDVVAAAYLSAGALLGGFAGAAASRGMGEGPLRWAVACSVFAAAASMAFLRP